MHNFKEGKLEYLTASESNENLFALCLFDESWKWECVKWIAEYRLSNLDWLVEV